MAGGRTPAYLYVVPDAWGTKMQDSYDIYSKIKPIQTKYKGYRFRSRLEARWAVYFDTIGLIWDYESEGFDLCEYGWYLPDFYLPQVQSFLEVKPSDYAISEDERKYHAFVTGTEKSIIIVTGSPDIKFYDCYMSFFNSNQDPVRCVRDVVFIGMYHNYPIEEHRFYACPGEKDPLRENIVGDLEVYSVEKSRSARFEHGEHP